jgi:7-cyano-7-deazaguanine synthase
LRVKVFDMADRGCNSCVLLLSGGVDSAVTAHELKAQGWEVEAMFVDYGQPAAHAERVASSQVAAHYDVPWRTVGIEGVVVPREGEIAGRNDLLLSLARATIPGRSVAIGIHSGTEYADCSPAWVTAWQALLDVQSGGIPRVLAPLLGQEKREIIAHAREAGVPLELTHSCERGNRPCGECLSCRDRGRARAGKK